MAGGSRSASGPWDEWRSTHQPFELSWWAEHLDQLEDPQFGETWAEVREFVQPKGRVLDIGCGPRTPFAPCAVIEPLGQEYIKLGRPEWWEGVDLIAEPAEKHQFMLCERFDTVICWNALDHMADWRKAVMNMAEYGKRAARYAVALDFYPPFLGHPGVPAREFEALVGDLFEIKRFRISPTGELPPDRFRALALVMTAR